MVILKNADAPFEEQVVRQAIILRAVDKRQQEQDQLARSIRNEIADAWNKGQKKGSSEE